MSQLSFDPNNYYGDNLVNKWGFLNTSLPAYSSGYSGGFVKPAYTGTGAAVPTADTIQDALGSASGKLGTSEGINWFGKNGVIGNAAMGLEALSGLANAYTGYKAYKLAKKQFGFQKALANRNLMNQAKIINNTYDNAAQVASGMIGSRNADGTYGFTDPNVTRKYEDKAKTQHVNGSAI